MFRKNNAIVCVQNFSIILLLSLLLLSSGCSTISKLEVLAKPVERIKLNIEKPPVLDLNKVKFIIIKRKNVEKVFSDLEAMGVDPVLLGLSDEGYEILAKNVEKMQNYIALQKDIIKSYKKYYEKK